MPEEQHKDPAAIGMKAASLAKTIERSVSVERLRGTGNYLTGMFLLYAAICASAGAGILGIFFKGDPKIIGAIALIPASSLLSQPRLSSMSGQCFIIGRSGSWRVCQ